uniref:Estradiol 17-beta-dehydrogenase 11 n=1 Tax=Panagrellus redivivus TaxID=6233 RepID=A0A7E4ZXI5_PANRE
MSLDEENSASTILEYAWDLIVAIISVLYYVIEGTIKACLPWGYLPQKSVKNKIVLITGAGGGLGRLLAVGFGKRGARLVCWDVNEKHNEETVEILKKNGVDAFGYTVDISKRQNIYKAADRVKAEVGDVDVLINNAGIVSGKRLFENSDDLMELTMAVNTTSLFFTAKAFLPAMLTRNSGHVVTVASMAGKFGTAGLVDYCASKFGAIGFNDSLRAEMVGLKKNIHVTTICPYYINTGMFDGVSTQCPNVLPIMEPSFVVSRTIEAILTNQQELYLPRFCYFIHSLVGFLPYRATQAIATFMGVNNTMENFIGKPKQTDLY